MLEYLDRNRSVILATIVLTMVCAPATSWCLVKIASNARQRRWLPACTWVVVLCLYWVTLMSVGATAVVYLTKRGL